MISGVIFVTRPLRLVESENITLLHIAVGRRTKSKEGMMLKCLIWLSRRGIKMVPHIGD